jgi:VanZ family protein
MTGAAVKAVLAAYMLLIFFLSVRPGPAPLPGIWQIDKLYHFLAYALMGFLWVWTLGGLVSLKKGALIPARALGAAFIISTLFGAVMEVFQYFLPPREASFLDAAANALGALAGVVAAGWALKVLVQRSSKMQMKGG